MKTKKLKENKLTKEVEKEFQKEIERSNELLWKPECSKELFQFSLNALVAGMMQLDAETPNPISVIGTPHQFEMVANRRFNMAQHMNYGTEKEVFLFNKRQELLNVSFGLSNLGRVSKMEWLNEVAVNFLNADLIEKIGQKKLNCDDKGFLLANKYNEQLKRKLKNGLNVHDTLNYAHEEYDKNGMLGWELSDNKITEIDIVHTALFAIYVMNPITTIDIVLDKDSCPQELIIKIGQELLDVYEVYRFFRNKELAEFEALFQMIRTINSTILTQLIKEKLEKERLAK